MLLKEKSYHQCHMVVSTVTSTWNLPPRYIGTIKEQMVRDLPGTFLLDLIPVP